MCLQSPNNNIDKTIYVIRQSIHKFYYLGVEMADEGVEACCGLVIIGIYIYLLYLFFAYLFTPILYLSAGIMTIWILVNFSKACISCFRQELPGASENIPTGNQPAFKQYFFRKAFIDLRDITNENYELNKESFSDIIGHIRSLFDTEIIIVSWPVGVALLIAIPFAIITGGAAYLIVTFFHISIVLSSVLGIFLVSMTFRGIENLNMVRWRIFYACPNCFNKFSIPKYSCPKCYKEHTKLVPGQYGIFKRKCECGELLPTLFLNGKNKLSSKCPICDHKLTKEIGVSINVHYPIVGGPVSGKSSFLVAGMLILAKKSKEEGFNFSFPEKFDLDNFEKFQDNFKRGIPLVKTAELKPKAFLTTIMKEEKKKPPYLIYIYDAAGEIFGKMDILRAHKYFEYISGIFFLIDPFSIPVIRKEYESELLKNETNIKPSDEIPQNVYDRMIINLEQHKEKNKLLSGGKYNIPIAIIITKSDAFNIERKIANVDLGLPGLENYETKEDIYSERVRNWLITNGQDNLVRSIEQKFILVKYFSSSSLGRIPSDTSDSQFASKNVDVVIDWMFSHREIFD